ncbi:ABC transporter substrate-binding protein [Kribbella shirazensis]|uniref:Multiple sugar transport system substrate-binding protein n=1 Tax=Kribbella shirazensis TaxID=1105143 RepID=A0A7X6A1M1_9ACTN|nr:extracellular solute-binding protein [Kribbella shirazensis]NIK58397.1 multiple sugar transport system substrate-binding protein [Kribbella shirazensis]
MKARKIIAGTGAVLATALVATACGGSSNDGGATTGELAFAHNKPWDFDSFSKVSKQDIDISLKSTQYSGDPYRAFIRQSFRTKESPGLFTWEVSTALDELAEQGVIAETTDLWTDAVDKGYVTDAVRQLYTVDGKQYCTPISVDNWVMFYNKSVFKKYNLSVPTTWDQLMTVAATLKQRGVTPFWNQTKNFSFVWFQTLLAGTDLQLYNDLSTGKAKYTDPRVVAVMNSWLDLQKKGYFNDPGQTDFARDLMREGKIAMAPEGTWFTADAALAGMTMGKDVDMFVIPAVKPGAATPIAIETAPVCVGESSKQKSLGLKFSQWWMSPEGQDPWVKQQGNLPFNSDAEAPTPETKALKNKLASGKYEYYNRYFEATPVPIRTVALEQFSAFLTNRGNPMTYLTAIQTAADEYWAGR